MVIVEKTNIARCLAFSGKKVTMPLAGKNLLTVFFPITRKSNVSALRRHSLGTPILKLKDCRQMSLPILREFKQIN